MGRKTPDFEASFGSSVLLVAPRALLLLAMPSKIPKFDLKGLVPTEEELKAARLLLHAAGEKEQKSRMQGFATWLKGQDSAESIQASRGDERKQWLEMYTVHVLKSKAGQKKVNVSKGHTEKKHKVKEIHSWAAEKMDLEMGPRKGESWRKSGLLKSAPCPLTGSKEEHLLVYRIPYEWEKMDMPDITAFNIECDSEATAKDVEMLDEIMMNDDDDENKPNKHVEIKKEPKTDAEKDMEEVANFVVDIKMKVMEIAAMELEVREILAKKGVRIFVIPEQK